MVGEDRHCCWISVLYFQTGNFTPNGALSSQGYNLTHCRDSMKNCVKIKSMMFTKIVFFKAVVHV